MMDSVSSETKTRSRKNHSVILQKLASIGQAKVAESLGVHESTVSRWKDGGGDIEKFANVLATLGLQVAPIEMKLYPDDQIAALFTLLRAHMNRADGAEHFFLGTHNE